MSKIFVDEITGKTGTGTPPITLSGDTATLGSGVTNNAGVASGTIGSSVTLLPSGMYQLVASDSNTDTSTNQQYIDFHNCFTSTYESYFIDGQMVAHNNGHKFNVWLSTGGASYVNAGSYHNSTMEQMYTGNATHTHINEHQSSTYWDWGYSAWGTNHSSDAVERPYKVRIFIDFPYDNTKDTYGHAQLMFPHSADGGYILFNKGGGNFDNNVSVTGIRFGANSGNIVTWNYKVYGIRN